MAVLSFTLSPEAVSRFYDSLVCLGKFSESVTFEAARDRLVLTALNTTKYSYTPHRIPGQVAKDKFTCSIYNRALILVFKGRAVDPTREKDTNIEKCEVVVEDDPGEAKSRFIIKMTCKNGVLKTYRLTFESVTPMHAVFKHELVKNRWAISSRTLREFIEHFAPRTEQLDIYSEDGRANFVSYTEKITSGTDVLKQPLHTKIAIDTQEFSEFSVEEKLHVIISVKDFKAIVTHAGITSTAISAAYSYPFSPMLLKYNDEGMSSEFILMTIGDSKALPTASSLAGGRSSSSRPAPKQPLEASSTRSGTNADISMAPPQRPAAASLARGPARPRTLGPSPPPPQSLQSVPLLFPVEDDDRRWDPVDEEEEEMLRWDDSTDNVTAASYLNHDLQGSRLQSRNVSDNEITRSESTQRLPPTQRISQIRGLFDD